MDEWTEEGPASEGGDVYLKGSDLRPGRSCSHDSE